MSKDPNGPLGAVAEDPELCECGGMGNFHHADCIYFLIEAAHEG